MLHIHCRLTELIGRRYALDGEPYTIHIFLGNVTDEEVVSGDSIHSAHHHHHYAGSVYTFTSKWLDHCANCAEQARAKQLSTGQVPITLRLLGHARDPDTPGIHRIDHAAVEQYLRDNLTWKAVDVRASMRKLWGNLLTNSALG